MFLETPGMDEGYDAVNMARARDLIAGRALSDLPPGALTVRGSRSRSAPEETARDIEDPGVPDDSTP